MKVNSLNKMNNKVQKITLIAILVSISVIVSIIDKMISGLVFPFLPMAKVGLANIIILFAVYRFNFVDSLIMVILKSLLVGLIFGSIMSFVIGLSGSLLSFIVMYLLQKLDSKNISMIGVSVAGGFFHTLGQCLAILIIYSLGDVLLFYGAMLVVVSLVTSVIVGYIASKTIKYLDNYTRKNSQLT